jgi:hypothetical protein
MSYLNEISYLQAANNKHCIAIPGMPLTSCKLLKALSGRHVDAFQSKRRRAEPRIWGPCWYRWSRVYVRLSVSVLRFTLFREIVPIATFFCVPRPTARQSDSPRSSDS